MGLVAVWRRDGLCILELRLGLARRLRGRAGRAFVELCKHDSGLLAAHHADQPAQARDRRTSLPDHLHKEEQRVHEALQQLVVFGGQRPLRSFHQALDRGQLDLDDLRRLLAAHAMA